MGASIRFLASRLFFFCVTRIQKRLPGSFVGQEAFRNGSVLKSAVKWNQQLLSFLFFSFFWGGRGVGWGDHLLLLPLCVKREPRAALLIPPPFTSLPSLSILLTVRSFFGGDKPTSAAPLTRIEKRNVFSMCCHHSEGVFFRCTPRRPPPQQESAWRWFTSPPSKRGTGVVMWGGGAGVLNDDRSL